MKVTEPRPHSQKKYLINSMKKVFNHDLDFIDKKSKKVQFNLLSENVRKEERDPILIAPPNPYEYLFFKKPPISGNSWKRISSLIFSPKSEFNVFIHKLRQASIEKQDESMKNLPLYYVKYKESMQDPSSTIK